MTNYVIGAFCIGLIGGCALMILVDWWLSKTFDSTPTKVIDSEEPYLLDTFAAIAFKGYMSRPLFNGMDEELIAEMSYKHANAMLEERRNVKSSSRPTNI